MRTIVQFFVTLPTGFVVGVLLGLFGWIFLRLIGSAFDDTKEMMLVMEQHEDRERQFLKDLPRIAQSSTGVLDLVTRIKSTPAFSSTAPFYPRIEEQQGDLCWELLRIKFDPANPRCITDIVDVNEWPCITTSSSGPAMSRPDS